MAADRGVVAASVDTVDADRFAAAAGLRFADNALLHAALTHRSAGDLNNERLEFLGDAILDALVSEILYRRFPQRPEGDLTRLRSRLVRRESLARLARQIHLGDCLILGAGESRSGGAQRDSTLANALEALIGALWLDGGATACREWIERLYGDRLHALPAQLKDPKTRLQEWAQRRGEPLPRYLLAESWGEPHQRTFRIRCRVAGLEQETEGIGPSRRRAEQEAAEAALRALNERPDERAAATAGERSETP